MYTDRSRSLPPLTLSSLDRNYCKTVLVSYSGIFSLTIDSAVDVIDVIFTFPLC